MPATRPCNTRRRGFLRPDPRLAIPIAADDADALRVAAGLVRAAELRRTLSLAP